MCKKLICLVSLVLVLSLAGNASAAIAFDAASSAVDGGGDSVISWSHTIGSGSDRILVVASAIEENQESDAQIVSVKYNGVNMTYVSGTSIFYEILKTDLYYMLESALPSSGSYTVEITYAGTVSDLAAGAVSLTGVAQQAAEASGTNSEADSATISTNITTQTDSAWVVDTVAHAKGASMTTTTSGMVERWDQNSKAHTGAGSTKPVASAGSTTMSWSQDRSQTELMVHSLAAFAPSGAPSPPGKATNPSPSHQATGVSVDADLSWTAGADATSHDVYFGTDSTPDATEFQGNQTATTYEPGTMANDTTYYWRIDEVNTGGTTTGDVWNFTTEAAPQPPGKATNPSPSHEATGVSVDADLSWTAGSGATSHDVYFGTDSTPDATEFQGNQGGTTYEPGTMANDTTYYWRIDEVNAAGTTTGDVWNFTTEAAPPPPPGKATNPSPSHEATGVDVDADLSWTAGSGATSHDVYFGTDSTPDATEFQGNQGGTTYEPGTMDNDTTYYWRIDEKNSGGTTTGDVWNFTTEAEAAPPDPNLVGWWKLDESEGATADDSSGYNNDGSVVGDVTWMPSGGQLDGAASFTGGSERIEFSTSDMSASAGTVVLWGYPEGAQTQSYRYFFAIRDLPGGGNRVQLYLYQETMQFGVGLGDNYAVNTNIMTLSTDTWYHIALTWDGGDYVVYVDANNVDSGTYTGLSSMTTGGDIGNDHQDRDKGLYGRIDDVGVWDEALSAGDINDIYLDGIGGAALGKAWNPSPDDEDTGIDVDTDLSWSAGDWATSHDVYFGTDESPDATEFKGNQTATTYEPGTMSNDTTYYWRIDEINDANGDSPWIGDVWSFTTEAAPSPPGQATNPDPSHQETGVDVDDNLSWTAGSGATSHDVYFGTDESPDATEFKGNQTATTYEPGTMDNDTTYYWRIDEVNAYGTTTGNVWNFTTVAAGAPPGQASNPSPSHQVTGVSLNADLSWTAGSGATSRDVYFGTDSSPDATEFKGNQTATTYEPGTMDEDTTYYWRIDEVNAYGTTTGVVWNFTTTAGGGTGSGATPVADFMVVPTSGWDIYYKPEFVSKATGDITSYEWDFGDEQTSYDRAPNHQYASSGTYTVSLTVSGPGGSDIETKTNHITVNNFSTGYTYDDYVLTSATMTQWDDAVDDIETAGGGRILFDFSNQTIYIDHHRDFYGNNLIIDGQDKNVSLYYSGPDDCSQTEDQDALIRIHGNDNIFRNVDYDRFPEGISMRNGNRNLLENVTVTTICEDAMTMNGGGNECFDCIFRNCTLGASEDKAVMVNNGGRGVFRNLSFTDSTQPIRCTGSTGEYVIRHCNIGGSTNGLRCDGSSPGHLVYVEENTIGSGSQRGIRVYGYVDAIIRHNSFSGAGCDYGVWAFEYAKVRLEHNTITGYDYDGVSVDNSALADLGGGSVLIDGSSAASPGGNTMTGSSGYDVQNNTGSGIKAEYNYWDHSTVSEVEQYDVDGTVDVDPLGS